MKSKRILVLLSAYNGEKYISAQIESILYQKTEHQVDLLIRDDGSNDDTLNILQEYETKYPDRIKVVEGENIGYNKSFFWLIQEANGYDYYSLSDQDDVWLDNKLDIAVKY
ncbi:glycosyltransferase, partial [Massilicoli timonensis]